ncbi:uncharacterized protein V6R79_009598 [Siganus canaliculatus]
MRGFQVGDFECTTHRRVNHLLKPPTETSPKCQRVSDSEQDFTGVRRRLMEAQLSVSTSVAFTAPLRRRATASRLQPNEEKTEEPEQTGEDHELERTSPPKLGQSPENWTSPTKLEWTKF